MKYLLFIPVLILIFVTRQDFSHKLPKLIVSKNILPTEKLKAENQKAEPGRAQRTSFSSKTNEISEDLSEVEKKLAIYKQLSYEQFTPAQLNDFNDLIMQRAICIKKNIIKKYSGKYAGLL